MLSTGVLHVSQVDSNAATAENHSSSCLHLSGLLWPPPSLFSNPWFVFIECKEIIPAPDRCVGCPLLISHFALLFSRLVLSHYSSHLTSLTLYLKHFPITLFIFLITLSLWEIVMCVIFMFIVCFFSTRR